MRDEEHSRRSRGTSLPRTRALLHTESASPVDQRRGRWDTPRCAMRPVPRGGSSILTEMGEGMKRQVSAGPVAVLAGGLTFVAAVAPALAQTSGRESIQGTIVASGESGTRTLLSSVFVATGAFTGTGDDVEVANRPGDPENVTRDALVFRGGRIHIRVPSQP